MKPMDRNKGFARSRDYRRAGALSLRELRVTRRRCPFLGLRPSRQVEVCVAHAPSAAAGNSSDAFHWTLMLCGHVPNPNGAWP